MVMMTMVIMIAIMTRTIIKTFISINIASGLY